MSGGVPAWRAWKTTDYPIDVDELMREIERYLAVVEAFRAAGCDVGRIGRRKRSQMMNDRARPGTLERRNREAVAQRGA